MASNIKLQSFVVLATWLTIMHGSQGAVASEVEKQLDKVGTRVGKNEYISVFKEPPGEGGKKSKTYVLLSKLYMLGQNSNGDLNEVISYPGGPLKFRRQYIIPSASSSPPTQTHEKILFPREETTRKPSQYNVYNKKTIPVADIYTDRKQSIGEATREQQNLGLPPPLLRYLTQLEESGEPNLNPVFAESTEGQQNEKDTLGYYTLITVPRTKKASDGCPSGQSKDHRGMCRDIITFSGNVHRTRS